MTNRYKSTSPARTLTAIAFAILFSTTCVLGAIAPAHVQTATTAAPNSHTSLAA